MKAPTAFRRSISSAASSPRTAAARSWHFFAEVKTFIKDNEGDASLAPYLAGLKQGLAHLEQATMWFMQNAMTKPDNAGAGSYDYMHLFGLVALGLHVGANRQGGHCDQTRGQWRCHRHGHEAAARQIFHGTHHARDKRPSRPHLTRRRNHDGVGRRAVLSFARVRRNDSERLRPGGQGARSFHLRSRSHAARPRQARRRLHEVSTLGLATTVLRALKERGDLDTHLVDDVVLGCVDPVGEAGGDIARAAALTADYGNHVPGVQINRFCASGLDAINFAAAQIMAGQHDLTVGGGVESMSRVGIGASGGAWPVDPAIAIKSYFMPQGMSADLIATKYGFSRDDVDQYAVTSQQRAAKAWNEGRFKNSIAPVRDINGITLLDRDEHMRPSTDMQSLAALKPSFTMMGEQGGFDAVAVDAHPEVEKIVHVHHAGNSSGIVDGAAAVLDRFGRRRARPWRASRAQKFGPSPILARSRR